MRIIILSFATIIFFVGCFRFEDYQSENVVLTGKWQLTRILSTNTDSTLANGPIIEFLNEKDFRLDFQNDSIRIKQYLYQGGERLLLGNVLHYIYEFSDDNLTVSGDPAFPFEGQGKLSYFRQIE